MRVLDTSGERIEFDASVGELLPCSDQRPDTAEEGRVHIESEQFVVCSSLFVLVVDRQDEPSLVDSHLCPALSVILTGSHYRALDWFVKLLLARRGAVVELRVEGRVKERTGRETEVCRVVRAKLPTRKPMRPLDRKMLR